MMQGSYPVDFNFDAVKLSKLGFSNQEIGVLSNLINNNIKVTTNFLVNNGMAYEEAQRIYYMYTICLGKNNVDTKEELVRHLKKLNNHTYKVGIQDLKVSTINKVPRIAVVAGIKDEPFNIWNSKQYTGRSMLYMVEKVTSKNIDIVTKRKPQLKFKSTMEIENVLKINGIDNKGYVHVSFDKNYCRLCNRFIIIASFKRPEFHLGMYEIICCEGTTIYCFASTMGVRETAKYNYGTQRIYDFGFFTGEIKGKLDVISRGMYSQLHGVSVDYTPGNADYTLVDRIRQDADLTDDVEM